LSLATAEFIQAGDFGKIDWRRLEAFGLSPREVNQVYLSVIEWQSHLGEDMGLLG